MHLCLPDFEESARGATEFCRAVLSVEDALQSQYNASFKQVVAAINPKCVGFWMTIFKQFDLRTTLT